MGRLNQAALVGGHDQLGAVARAQLGHGPVHVGLGGGRADHEVLGDLFV
jgi:hypothetical protein